MVFNKWEMTTPISNNIELERMNTPHTDSAPSSWNTPEFHTDTALVKHRLREGVGDNDILYGFLEFLASPNGNRVLTYNQECHTGVKQMICGLWERAPHNLLNRICTNQGWMLSSAKDTIS